MTISRAKDLYQIIAREGKIERQSPKVSFCQTMLEGVILAWMSFTRDIGIGAKHWPRHGKATGD